MHEKGILHGKCIAFYKSGPPMTYAEYDHGMRDGIIKTWNEKGENIYWCQYADGFRHGYCCFFSGDQMRLLLEIKRDKTQKIYSLANGQLEKSFISEEKAFADENARNMLLELQKLESQLKTNEIDFKKRVRDEEERHRRDMMSDLNKLKREAILERIKQRDLAYQKTLESIRSFRPIGQSYRIYIISHTQK